MVQSPTRTFNWQQIRWSMSALQPATASEWPTPLNPGSGLTLLLFCLIHFTSSVTVCRLSVRLRIISVSFCRHWSYRSTSDSEEHRQKRWQLDSPAGGWIILPSLTLIENLLKKQHRPAPKHNKCRSCWNAPKQKTNDDDLWDWCAFIL